MGLQLRTDLSVVVCDTSCGLPYISVAQEAKNRMKPLKKPHLEQDGARALYRRVV